MNKRYGFLTKIKAMLYTEFDKLSEEFELIETIRKCSLLFVVANSKLEFRVNYEKLWKFSTSTKEELYKAYLEDECFEGALMYNRLLCVLVDGTPVQAIIVPKEALCEFLYYHVDWPEDILIDYLKHSLRHEVGHVLANIKIFKEHKVKEANEIIKNDAAEEERLWKEYIKEHDFDTLDEDGMREYYTYYHNLPMEKKANEAVGINIADTVEWEIKIAKESDCNDD